MFDILCTSSSFLASSDAVNDYGATVVVSLACDVVESVCGDTKLLPLLLLLVEMALVFICTFGDKIRCM